MSLNRYATAGAAASVCDSGLHWVRVLCTSRCGGFQKTPLNAPYFQVFPTSGRGKSPGVRSSVEGAGSEFRCSQAPGFVCRSDRAFCWCGRVLANLFRGNASSKVLARLCEAHVCTVIICFNVHHVVRAVHLPEVDVAPSPNLSLQRLLAVYASHEQIPRTKVWRRRHSTLYFRNTG